MLLKAEHLQQLNAKGAEYVENENFPEALEVYNEAIKLSAPNKARTLDILHKTAQVQFNMCLFDEAIETCDTALDLDENFFNALRLRARCHYKLSHLTLAENDYREAILRSDESQHESLIEDLMEVNRRRSTEIKTKEIGTKYWVWIKKRQRMKSKMSTREKQFCIIQTNRWVCQNT